MNHKKWMAKALALAKRGSPQKNPMVGAVIVKDGRIIGQGYHKMDGDLHGEIMAIEDAGADLTGAVLYCTLEPCSCVWPGKKNPPCTERLIHSGLNQIYLASLDPNPKVKGMGVRALKKAGLSVSYGILEQEERYLNRRYRKQQLFNSPYVHLKMAQTLDGCIAKERGVPTDITGNDAKKEVHLLRRSHQAVLVGKGTVLSDDPRLTVRLCDGENPLRVVIDSRLEIPPLSNLCRCEEAQTLVYHGFESSPSKKALLESMGVITQQLPIDTKGKIYLQALLEDLQGRGIHSLLVEGGCGMASSFLEEQLVEEISWFVHPRFGGKGLQSVDSSNSLWDCSSLYHESIHRLGKDMLIRGLTDRGVSCLQD